MIPKVYFLEVRGVPGLESAGERNLVLSGPLLPTSSPDTLVLSVPSVHLRRITRENLPDISRVHYLLLSNPLSPDTHLGYFQISQIKTLLYDGTTALLRVEVSKLNLP